MQVKQLTKQRSHLIKSTERSKTDTVRNKLNIRHTDTKQMKTINENKEKQTKND